MLIQMTIQIDSKLKSELEYIAKLEGKSTGKLVGDLLKKHVRDKHIDYYIDDLWKRIGDHLRRSDFDPDDIIHVVHKVRKLK